MGDVAHPDAPSHLTLGRTSGVAGADEAEAGVPMSVDFRKAFGGRRVLVTGHTGFKGGWLCAWLLKLGAEVHGLALAPSASPSLYKALSLADRISSDFVDVRDAAALNMAVGEIRPEIVFHLAAQPLVRRSYDDPIETFATNVLGTAHLLEACRCSDVVKAVVCVTTDKVYFNREWPWPYRETDQLGGLDPYSASKACVELVTHVYQHSLAHTGRQVRIATARGGNVVGGGDWSVDRIVPDVVRALRAGQTIALRNPDAIRPWQHVLELCEGYLELGARLMTDQPGIDDAWNFGPPPSSTVTVRKLVDAILSAWGAPDHPVTVESAVRHEAQILRLDTSKALHFLDWRPRLDIIRTLAWTAEWYRSHQLREQRAWELTTDQIGEFEALRLG